VRFERAFVVTHMFCVRDLAAQRVHERQSLRRRGYGWSSNAPTSHVARAYISPIASAREATTTSSAPDSIVAWFMAPASKLQCSYA
jgi:hypothetical protein